MAFPVFKDKANMCSQLIGLAFLIFDLCNSAVRTAVYVDSRKDYCCTEPIGRIDTLLRHLKRFGYLQHNLRFPDLLDKLD